MKRKIVGYAVVYNSESFSVSPAFSERIAKGAFTKSIARDDVRGLWNHDPNYPLGRVKAKTLKLSEDEKGLKFEIDPPPTQYAKDLMISIERGDVSQNSIGFSITKETWSKRLGGSSIRTIEEGKLYDVSPVTFAAYEETQCWLED